MLNMYNTTLKHRIIDANYNLYVNGISHSGRVMPVHDFIYLIEGGWEIYQNGVKYELFPDNVLILQANQHHYGEIPCLPNTKTMYLHVTSEHGDGLVSERVSDDFVYLNVLTDCGKNKKVKNLFKEIISEKWMPSKQSDIKLSALFDLMLCEMSNSDTNEKLNHINLVNDALGLIRSNPNIFYTVGELAESLRVSEKTLQNAVKSHTGFTVHKYQTEKKLELAALQLRLQPDIKIYELSLNLGFYDEFHLSKLFKNKYAKSIRDYRKEIRSENINHCSFW